MRIALYFTTLGRGGTERVLVRLANEFVRAGHEADLVLMRLGDHAYAEEIDGRVRIVDLGVRHLKGSLPHFVRYLRRTRPDAVISAGDLANGFAGFAARLVRPRPLLIFSHHGFVARSFSNLQDAGRSPLTWLLRHSHRLADAIVGVSEGVADNIRRLPGVSSTCVHRIFNPAWHPSMEERAREAVDYDWFNEPAVPVLAAVGRLETVKDFPILIRAVALLRQRRPARLLILGEGSQRPALEQLVAELGLDDSVRMPGFVDNAFAYMAHSSLFVLSSRDEGFGNVLIEAMACGTPVVSTDCPSGPREILQDGRYGPLVPMGDTGALAAAIDRQLDNPVPAALLKARAREFSAEASAHAYLRLIESLREKRR